MSLKPGHFSGLKNLNLDCTRINKTFEIFSRDPKMYSGIKELNLSNNDLFQIDSSMSDKFENLEKLILTKNPIQNLNSNAFCELPKLKSHNLSSFNLKTFHRKILRTLQNLNYSIYLQIKLGN
jgi:hypothetical protein